MVTDEVDLLEQTPSQLYVDGEWRPSSTSMTFTVEDPATGEVLVEVADACPADGTVALDAAVAAQRSWHVVPPRERAEILRRTYEALTARVDELALLMTMEMGKPLADARAEVAYAAEFFRWFSEEAVRISGRYSVAPAGGSRIITIRQPVGPCLFITPWNFPIAMGARKIAPAVAAGCTMVVKPAQQTPLSMLALARILDDAGLPPGVCNVVPTSSSATLTAPLLSDPRLRKLSFTGSTAVGKALIRQSADQVLRVSMELGGNAPFLIFADADLEAAVDGAVLAKMRNIGEACTAANRFYVHESVASGFSERLAERLGAMKMGRGTEDGVTVGPLIDAATREKVTSLVDDAVSKGAEVVTGGSPATGPGNFYPPTVLASVPPSARLLREEIFGPVAPVVPFSSEEEAVDAANDTEYGLVAYVFTTNVDKTFRVAEALETGMVAVNQGIVSNPAAPFGGVKHSGFGREGGPEGIEEYLETKYVALRT